MEELVVGVDVGTASVRAALIDKYGNFKKIVTKDIKIWNPEPNFFEQSSENIWRACCSVVKEVTMGFNSTNIKGIGFDATCSLVAIDKFGLPVTISKTGNNTQNVIMWMDHRAQTEAEFVNNLEHYMLKYVGGKVSLEMQVPKLMWLKRNLKNECWDNVDKFFDLPDFLTWKATGCDSRSLCSVVCKWMFETSSQTSKKWNSELYSSVGLEDLLSDNCNKIGNIIKEPGEVCGKGLSAKSADELGLLPGTTVATSIIDAHAGGLGLIGCSDPETPSGLTERIALICGTSTCHMKVSENEIFVRGVWGPYFSAMVPGFWLTEAGQSASGKLLDYIIETHPASRAIAEKFGSKEAVYSYLNGFLEKLAKGKGVAIDVLTNNLHVWPDFHGNRSPIADPTLRGMVSGLDLSSSEEQLSLLYLATLQALAYGTKHIIDVLKENGNGDISCILICGGLSKNQLFVQTQANVVSKAVLIPKQSESVLLGSAILAATAASIHSNVQESILNMSGVADKINPDKKVDEYHNKKYKVFRRMLEDQLAYRKIMEAF